MGVCFFIEKLISNETPTKTVPSIHVLELFLDAKDRYWIITHTHGGKGYDKNPYFINTHRNSKAIKKLKKAKLITGFQSGQEVILTSETMGKIARELENWYTEFLMKHFSPGRGK